jgi:hypothetical protein
MAFCSSEIGFSSMTNTPSFEICFK